MQLLCRTCHLLAVADSGICLVVRANLFSFCLFAQCHVRDGERTLLSPNTNCNIMIIVGGNEMMTPIMARTASVESAILMYVSGFLLLLCVCPKLQIREHPDSRVARFD